mgnify:FL=1
MNIYKYLTLFVTVLSAAILQPTFLTKIFLPGATPDLGIVVVVCWALLKGPAIGAIAGFGAGFFIDVLPPGNHIMGISSIILTIMGYLIGILGQNQSRSLVRPLIVSASAATLFLIIRSFWGNLNGMDFSLNIFAINFITQAIYASILTIFVFPLIGFLDKKLGPISRSEELKV